MPNDIIQEIIINKIKLFTKENYFKYFSNILIELSHNILAFQKKSSLSITISSNKKDKHRELWLLITKLILPLKEQYFEQNENEYENENESDLNPLCFEYLKNLCHKTMKHLTSLSLTEQIPLKRIIPLYLNLCEKQIKINKEKQFGIFRRYDKENNYTKIIKKASPILVNKQNSFLNRTQIKINSKKVGGKNMPSIQQLDYSNSFTRLFIGETDEDSIRERYLSNMVVKKHKQLHLLNSFMDLSSMYLKRMYYKLFKKEGGKGVMDKDMINVINQFENDHKKVENFQRNAVSSEKGHQFDYMKNQLLLELQSQKQKYIKKPKKKRKNKNTFMTTSISRNNELVKMNQDAINSSKNLLGKNRTKSQSNMINSDNRTNNDIFLLDRKIVNSHGNNRYKNIKKSFSVLNRKNKNYDRKIYRSSSAITKRYNNEYNNRWNNATLFYENRKKYYLNYMNNNDFFFSQV